MAPTRLQRLVVDLDVQVLRRDAPAGGSADLHGLERLAVGDAAADVEDDLAQRDAHGHLDEARVHHLAGEGEDLRALRVLPCPWRQKLSAPSRMMWETFAMVSTLLTMVGFWNKPDTEGNGGRGRGMPRRPSTEAMSAVSSPQTKAPAPFLTRSLNWKPRCPTGFSRRPSALRTVDCLVDALDGQGILGAAVDDALVGADGVTGHHHAFQDGVGVAFEDGAVHERARVALVRVADHVLLLVLRRAGRAPTSCPWGTRCRPVRAGPDRVISWITSSGVIPRARSKPLNPPCAR